MITIKVCLDSTCQKIDAGRHATSVEDDLQAEGLNYFIEGVREQVGHRDAPHQKIKTH